MVKYSINTFWDTRKVNSLKQSVILLVINLNGKQIRFSLGLKSTKPDYEKAISNSRNESVKLLKDSIVSAMNKAEGILERLGDKATKELFMRLYKSDSYSSSDKVDVYVIMKQEVDLCNKADRFGSAMNIYNAINSFRSFRDKLYFEDITVQFLKEYKAFMIKNGRSVTTAGIYLRALRSIYKQCIKDGIIVVNKNPFDEISCAWTVATKSVLYPIQLKSLWNYQPETLRETRAKDFFFFCYLCNGMNFKDVSTLKWKDIKNDMITFIRSKTKDTTTNAKEIKVYIDDEIRRIINVYGSPARLDNEYIFDIFNNCRNTAHHNATFKRHGRQCNKSLRSIADKIGIEGKVCLGIARHSFATKHKIDGTPSLFISEAMGHANGKTTENYLKTLPDENVRQMNTKLLSF